MNYKQQKAKRDGQLAVVAKIQELLKASEFDGGVCEAVLKKLTKEANTFQPIYDVNSALVMFAKVVETTEEADNFAILRKRLDADKKWAMVSVVVSAYDWPRMFVVERKDDCTSAYIKRMFYTHGENWFKENGWEIHEVTRMDFRVQKTLPKNPRFAIRTSTVGHRRFERQGNPVIVSKYTGSTRGKRKNFAYWELKHTSQKEWEEKQQELKEREESEKRYAEAEKEFMEDNEDWLNKLTMPSTYSASRSSVVKKKDDKE